MRHILTVQLGLLGGLLVGVFACYMVLATIRDRLHLMHAQGVTQTGYLRDMRNVICTDVQDSFVLPEPLRKP